MRESLRKIVKQALASLVFYSGFLHVYLNLRRKLSLRPDFTILMYHQVLDAEHGGEDHLPSGMVTLENTFDKQMEYLKQHCNVISLDDLVGCLRDQKKLPARSVVITFDDGWRDNHVFAFPILKKHGLPATIFLCSDYVGTSKMFWFHTANFVRQAGALTSQKMTEILNGFEQISPEEKRAIIESLTCAGAFLEKLKRIKPHIQERIIVEMTKQSDSQVSQMGKRRWMLNWDEVEEMRESRISFGSHARSHTILTHLDLEDIKNELTESKKAIEGKIKKPAIHFAYPNGDYNSVIKELVKETGYLCACTTANTSGKRNEIDLFALPRMGIHEGMSIGIAGRFSKTLFACHLAGLVIRRRSKYERSVGD